MGVPLGQLFARSICSLLHVAGFQFEIENQGVDVTASVRLRMMLLENFYRLIAMVRRDKNFRLQQESRGVSWVCFERAFDQLLGFLGIIPVKKPLRVAQIRLAGFLLLAHQVVKLGKPHLHARIFGFYFQQAIQCVNGFRPAIRFEVRFGNLQEERPGFAEYALLHVKIGEPFERREFGRRQLGYFFVDRDCFAIEAVVQIDLREPFEILDGLRHLSLARIKIANGH